MISILEMIGWHITIIPIVIFKATTLPVVINSGIVYLIVLPRVFLMNTSHNRHRIIEHGWRNVLRNTLGISSTPLNLDCSQGKERMENKNVGELTKRNKYHRHTINHQMLSRDNHISLNTVSAATLKGVGSENLSKSNEQPKKKQLEIMLIPNHLKRQRQIYGSINILGCEEKPPTKTNRLKTGKLILIDLEEEGEVLFSCK